MEAPLLSIITPVYNGQRFIGSCLQSVIDQNCPDVEHLIMDGGSTDQTVKIIEQYAKRYQHIRLVSEKDKGQSSAMNKGISLARGRVIGFLNSDDYYQPAVLPKVVDIFQDLPAPSFLVGNCNVLNDDEKITNLNKPSHLSLTNILIRGEVNQFPYNPSAYFYHRSLHEKIGAYDESNHHTMDIDFLLRMSRVAHIKYVDETWGNFRFIRGTKTFQSKVDNQLRTNEMRVMDAYLKELPWFHQWWIRINRQIQFFFDTHKVHYYAGRIREYFRDPQKIVGVLAKKIRTNSVPGKSKNRDPMDQINTKQEENIFQWVNQRIFFYVTAGKFPGWPYRYLWAKEPFDVFLKTFPEDPVRITALFIKLLFRQIPINQFILLARAPGMLKDAVDACRSAGLKPFLLFGTLRGFILKNDFLPRTCDIDFGLLEEDYEKRGLLIKIMLKKGYRIGINAEYELLFHSNESHLLMIDFFNVYEGNKGTVISTGFAENKKLVSNDFPAGLFQHFRMVDFYRVKVLVPLSSKEFINLHYGPWTKDFINKRHHIDGRTNVRLEDKFNKPLILSQEPLNSSMR